MHPEFRNYLIVEIANRLFSDGSTCYYRFYTAESDLDMVNNRYFFEVNFEGVENVNAYIMNGTDFSTANDPYQVNFYSGYKFQYQAENNQLFMTFQGNAPDSDDIPNFKFSIRLYTFRVTPYTDEEIFGELDLITDPNANVEPITNVDTAESVIVVDPSPKKRKKQHGLTVLTVAAMFGILIYICCSCVENCKRDRNERDSRDVMFKELSSKQTVVSSDQAQGQRPEDIMLNGSIEPLASGS